MARVLYHGAAYYPELWDEKVIDEDIKLMKETGINVVRMGEFAWSKMEPEEGKIDISFFKEVIIKLYENGIKTIMCTPTATPPIWFSYGHPERMYVDRDGKTMGHGARQHACTNHPYFRERAAIITEHIAKEVGNLPGLVGWQIDNEFKCHVSECMCETCRNLWHEWLKQRYQTIDALNEAWGTQIWSEYYQDFHQVPQPGHAPFLHNSSLQTMYRLFSMEKIAKFCDEQAAIIRKYSSAPITHNSNIAFSVDQERLFENLDFASFDTYATIDNLAGYLMNHDLYRNIKKGKSFWVMETSPSHAASLESYANPHPNGYLKVEAVAAYALGAEGFCYWLWRQQRAGCEQPHGSVISAWGKPTVGYANVLEVERARKEIEPIILSTIPMQAEVAITYSDRAKAFLKTEPHRQLDYRRLITEFYDRILRMGIHRDLIPETASLDGYKILFTPFVPYLSPDYIERARQFVENGGIWIVGPLSGGRTEEHTVHTDRALGELEKMAGAEVLYTYPMDGTGTIGRAFGVSAPLGMWSSVFEFHSEHCVGVIEEGLSKGKSFINEHRIGKGKIVMLGSMPIAEEGDKLLVNLVNHYANEANVNLRTDATAGTIAVPRKGDGCTVWFIINMDGQGGSVTIPAIGVDMLTGAQVSPGKLQIGNFEYRVVQFCEKGI
ncbi:Beta-galactosidase YesZ [Geobacillus sp. PA-3]|uniref:beta-galactosidase n=1 Tax=Geobacillus sp. PA-3 TaxID=1699078 RepID=UPI0006E5AC3F|nr:beta-galactosidase [Geobacillus sp. PA-3]KQB94464.1 Beta-galactosidase YesZ [Geobacillus sp. PA-3]